MRSLIDAIEKVLSEHPDLSNVVVRAYGPTYEIPESIPYVNIIPRAKLRERQYFIGTNISYDVKPEVELHIWQASLDNLRTAFGKCEDLAETVLSILAGVSAATLNVHQHESSIESYEDMHYELTYYYAAVIVLKAVKDESY